ncbi:Hsp70 protein [Saccharopolyspora antimicrobica]|uniref:Hsp70 protein n=2 Tax=Saccharopolyspora antimicrobica TaxID=455193 RepID=A0A1I5I428_9PSEU|nr:Hsp70 protein [Saccharopolyspora antimicrobica]SFO55313.1 Hsp70 protein [Saccharopolyspora antimicrobica]
MSYAIGIDLGTTFTSAAVGDAAGTRMVPLSRDIVVPSLAYHAPDGTLLTGAAAAGADGDPARLGRGFKRRLGDPTPLVLGGATYSPSALMAAQLRAVLDQVRAHMGGPPGSIVLTCPAIWGPYRREQFAEVPRLAGVENVQVITEPEAAATHYSRERALGEGEVVAVFDLGGGTLDTTVLRMRSDGMEILGTPEGVEHLGGMDFDDALLAHFDERLDGAITRLDPADPAAAAALAQIRTQCVRAKIDLSTEPDVTLNVALPSGARELTITRREFNAAIRPSVEVAVDALRRTVASAGLRGDDLSAVLLAGGSSRVPLVTQLVFEQFDKPVRMAHHPKFTVALGAATIGTRALTAPPPRPVQAVEPARSEPKRRRWLVPAIAAAAAVVTAVVGGVLLFSSGPDVNTAASTRTPAPASSTSDASAVQGAQLPDPLLVFDDDTAGPYRAFISSQEKWDGTEVIAHSARHAAISATTGDGLRVNWTSNDPAQIYLQTGNNTRDLSSYADNDGALVFDVVVNQPLSGSASVATHCGYPCGAELDATGLFRGLPVGSPAKVTIPLSCFTEKGLDPKRVNTPFLVYAQGSFDATFRNITWVAGAATSPQATPCSALS